MDTTKILLKFTPLFLRKKIVNNKDLRKILDNINWLGGEKILQLFLAIFVSALVARYLGPEQFGLMNYAIAFVSLFVFFNNLGLDSIVVRNIVNNPDKKADYLGSAIVLRFLGSFFLLVFSVLGVIFLRPDENLLHIFVFIIAIAHFFKSFATIDLWFQSQVRSKYTVQSHFIAFFTISVLKIIFILTQQPLIAFVLMFLLDSIIAAVLLIGFYEKKGPATIFKWKAKVKTMKELLKDSWPLILSGMAVTIYMRIDQIMIGNMLGDTELGIYSIAVKLSETWLFLPMIIAASVFPAILNAKKKSEKLYFARLQNLYDAFTWFTIPVAIIVLFLSPYIIQILFGEEYLLASSALSILIFSGTFSFLGVASSKHLIVEDLMRISFYRTLLGVFANVILNLILIPQYGIIGSAIATLVSYAFSTFSVGMWPKGRVVAVYMLKSFNLLRIVKDLI